MGSCTIVYKDGNTIGLWKLKPLFSRTKANLFQVSGEFLTHIMISDVLAALRPRENIQFKSCGPESSEKLNAYVSFKAELKSLQVTGPIFGPTKIKLKCRLIGYPKIVSE